MIEAGTGVGKSFAYLVPAILATAAPEADRRARRILISTHTISLQEQLITKDIPLLNAVIPLEFSAVLVKGRHNYLSRPGCATRWPGPVRCFAKKQSLPSCAARQLGRSDHRRVVGRFARPAAGPSLGQGAKRSWQLHGARLPHLRQLLLLSGPPQGPGAQLLIVNHALFFSDLALHREGASILPDYDAVIFDEAHNLESVAGDHFGLTIHSGNVEYVLNKLYNDRTNRGLLVAKKLADAERQVLECRFAADEFFHAVRESRELRGGSNGRVTTPEIVDNALSPALAKLSRMVRSQAEFIIDREDRQDFTAAADRLTALAGQIDDWLEQRLENNVYWVDVTRGRRPRVSLDAAPIDVGPALRAHLFEKVGSVIMTSATLAVGKQPSFDYFNTRLGLTKVNSQALGSSFDYQRQAELVLVDGMPDPNSERDAFERAAIGMIKRYVARTDGHAFVLFTSYEMLRRAASELTPWLASHDLALYSQADGGSPPACSSSSSVNHAACCLAPIASGKVSMCRETHCAP